jgi:hypothetical protein
MQVIEAQRASILVPHDHLHISQMSVIRQGYMRVVASGMSVGYDWACIRAGSQRTV